ncbi:hypothetical protein AHIS1636_21350 [Arthrobacter mangrovi]|uniref:Uncharacterized protein n=1 Tax=Arthrobacter mangrovi TaxID=2966350 RepID=A0ABQ5MUS3_9MICC|nr:hypothetical protein AHIS1636_21350 [Arthrobacter mangrovi]
MVSPRSSTSPTSTVTDAKWVRAGRGTAPDIRLPVMARLPSLLLLLLLPALLPDVPDAPPPTAT